MGTKGKKIKILKSLEDLDIRQAIRNEKRQGIKEYQARYRAGLIVTRPYVSEPETRGGAAPINPIKKFPTPSKQIKKQVVPHQKKD